MFETKIGVVLREDLKTWPKLNVPSFLSAGVAASAPDSIGEPYEDGSSNTYLSLVAQPVLVFVASAQHLQRTRVRARSRGASLAIYTKEMFTTYNDNDNRAVVKAVPAENLDIVGLAFTRRPQNLRQNS